MLSFGKMGQLHPSREAKKIPESIMVGRDIVKKAAFWYKHSYSTKSLC